MGSRVLQALLVLRFYRQVLIFYTGSRVLQVLGFYGFGVLWFWGFTIVQVLGIYRFYGLYG